MLTLIEIFADRVLCCWGTGDWGFFEYGTFSRDFDTFVLM